MPRHPAYGNLVVLEQNMGVTLQDISEDCVRVQYRNKYWHVWLVARCWIECDENDLVIGVMHYGSVGSFYSKEINKKPGVPRNHYKKWENSELQVLSELANANTKISEAASVLERTDLSVASKFASEYGISIDQHIKNPSLGSIRFKSLSTNKD